MQSDGEKKVKAEKEARKYKIFEAAEIEFEKFFDEQADLVQPFRLLEMGPIPQPNVVIAAKGKRSIAGVEDAVNEEIARCKTELTVLVSKMIPNVEYLKEHGREHAFLFSDATSLFNQDEEAFQALVQKRITDYKAQVEEEARVKAEEAKQREATKEVKSEAEFPGLKPIEKLEEDEKEASLYEAVHLWQHRNNVTDEATEDLLRVLNNYKVL